mmetsp:Transcript_15808/g.42121  ORF Transcript_15808/g.42121 Transcript_15808/m.42121 type:complete len:443 (+) Transcript_15808:183-1511(+)
MPRQSEADPMLRPVVGGVVLAQDGLAQDPHLRAEGGQLVHGQQRGSADELRLVRRLRDDTEASRARVLLGANCDVHLAELENDVRPRERPAVDLPARSTVDVLDLAGQQPVQVLSYLPRSAQQGRAGVRNRDAATVLAQADGLVADPNAAHLQLPIPQLWLAYGSPSQLGAHPGGVVPAEGDLAGDRIALRQENPETRLHPVRSHLAEETELGLQCEASEPETEDAVEVKSLEWLWCHLCCQDNTSRGAMRTSRDWRDVLTTAAANADHFPRELADNFASAVGDRHLVALLSTGVHLCTIVIQIYCGARQAALVARVAHTGLGLALGRGHKQMTRTSIEHHGELLWPGQADADGPEVSSLVHHRAVVPRDGHVVLAQRDGDQPRGRSLLGLLFPPAQAGGAGRRGREAYGNEEGGRGLAVCHRHRCLHSKVVRGISVLERAS